MAGIDLYGVFARRQHAAQVSRRNPEGIIPVHAAVAVSTPIDLAESAARLLLRRRNAVYHSWLLNRMKDQWRDTHLVRRNAAKPLDANSIVQFDDRIVAPVNGFKGARAYYKHNSAERFLKTFPCRRSYSCAE